MNELPPIQPSNVESTTYSQTEDPAALAALILLESQDSIYQSIEEGIESKLTDIRALTTVHKALSVAMEYARKAEKKAIDDHQSSLDENQTIEIEADDAEDLQQGLDASAPATAEDDNQQGGHVSPEQQDAITDSQSEHKPGKKWRVTIKNLHAMIQQLVGVSTSLASDIEGLVDLASRFLDDSEETLSKLKDSLDQTGLDPSLLATFNSTETRQGMIEFHRMIESTEEQQPK